VLILFVPVLVVFNPEVV